MWKLPSRGDVLASGGVLAALSLTWLPRLTGPLDLRWDAASYYILGTSLAQGHGYRYLSEPGELPGVVWPPLLPAFVALHQLALGTSDPAHVAGALRVSFFVIWCLYILIAYAFFRQVADRWIAVAGCLLIGGHMTTIWLSDRLYTDLPFALFVTTFVLITLEHPRRTLAPWLLGTAAFMLRTAGAAVLVAWVCDAALAQRWRVCAVRLVLALIPIGLWQAYVHDVERWGDRTPAMYAYAREDAMLYNVSYQRNMMLRDPSRPEQGRVSAAQLPLRMASNLTATPRRLGESISLLEKDWVRLMEAIKQQPLTRRLVPWASIPVTLILFGALALVGAWRSLFTRRRLIVLVLLAYLGLLALLPTDYHWPRYLAALAPIICVCFFYGLQWLARLSRTLVALTVLLVFGLQLTTAIWYFRNDLRRVSHGWVDTASSSRMFTYDPAFEAFDRAIDWIAERAEHDDIVVSSMPHWVYLRTNLRAVMPPFHADVTRARELLQTVRARYVVVDRSGFSPTAVYAAPAIAEAGWRVVFDDESGLAQVYEADSARGAGARSNR